MKKYRIWVQHIVDGDVAGTMEVGTDSMFLDAWVWEDVKRAMSTGNMEIINFKEYEEDE